MAVERGRGGGEGVRTRDHLANVRTTLSWVRFSVVLMGVGYALDKLAVLGLLSGTSGLVEQHGRALGRGLVVVGVVVAGAALPRFARARSRVESGRFEPHIASDLALVALLAAGGLGLLAVLAASR